jgi:3-hydroxybutyryl-CoA dehydrogenase
LSAIRPSDDVRATRTNVPATARFLLVRRFPDTAAVAGAGTMGTGIACVLALGGSRVRVLARRKETLEKAAGRVGSIARALEAPDPAELAARLSFTSSAEECFAGAGLVVESIAEDTRAKLELLARAERLATADAIVTTNTSSLSIAALAGGLERPERFAGLHWFNPPELVPLVEVVAGERTEPDVLDTLRAWMEALGKTPIVVRKDTPGFVANRLQYGLVREAWALVEDGVCTYEDVDKALTYGLGARWAAVGPFRIADLAGLDVYLAVIRNLFPELSRATLPPRALVETVEAGDYGAKSGRGLLGDYEPADAARVAEARDSLLRAIELARAVGSPGEACRARHTA